VALRAELPSTAHSLEVKATRPDGSSDVLLWIRDYHPEWPTPYVFREPVALPQGSTLSATARVDGAASGLAVTLTTIDGRVAAAATPAVHEH